MQPIRKLVPLEYLLDEDLEAICTDVSRPFAEMGGSRLLVTGGGGFLGYYLVQAALHWNRTRAAGARIKVAVYDNYLFGVPGWLEALRREPDLELARHDMCQPLPAGMGHFDWIVHAAGIASPPLYRAQPLKCIDANLIGLRNLLEYAVAEERAGHPVRGVLFYSSSEIYGDPAPHAIPTPEDYRGNVSCTGPRACYDETKRFGETLCVTYARHHGVPVRIARPFNNYGPGLRATDGRVIPDFARNVLSGSDIVMLSDGKPTRTFCYASDAVSGYYRALVLGGDGEPYNVGIEGPEISMAELAHLTVDAAAQLFGYRGKVRLGRAQEADYLVDNPNRRCPDISKARTQIGYDPKVHIAEGIYRSLVWYHQTQLAEAA